MKWLFILAIILNIAFFFYNLFVKEGIPEVANKPVQDKTQIVLISELSTTELAKLQSVSAEAKQVNEAEAVAVENAVNTTAFKNIDSEFIRIPEGLYKTACFKLGPFASKKEMDNVKIELEKEFSNILSYSIETTSETTYYRIYIPPLKTKEEINKALEKLDNKGLTDHYVMAIDGRKNAIALGVFKKRNAAESVARRAKRIGYATTIEAITKDKNSKYTLQVDYSGTDETSKLEQVISLSGAQFEQCKKQK